MDTQKNLKTLQQKCRAFGMTAYLQMMLIRSSEKYVKLILNPFGTDGTSGTNGKVTFITLWEEFYSKSFKVVKKALEFFTLHEGEHNRSSNFDDMKLCGDNIAKYYNLKYGYNEKVGYQLGCSLYNIIEDGRIERIAINRFPGQIMGFKLVNAIIYQRNEIDVNKPSTYADFISGMLTLSKLGLKPKNWDTIYAGSEADLKLNDIAWIIYDATQSNFTADVVKAVEEVNKIIDPFIYEALAKDSDLLDKLEQMAQDAPQVSNSADKQAQQAGQNGSSAGAGGQSINTPQGIPGGSGQGQQGQSQGQTGQGSSGQSSSGSGVGNTGGAKSAEEAADTAQEKEVDPSELESQIENDQQEDEAIDKRMKQQQDEEAKNSDDEVSKEELNNLGKDSGLDYGNAHIEHFQQALEEEASFDVTPEIQQDGNKIYNNLKKLFMEKNDLIIRKQRKGKLDVHRFPNMVAMRNAEQIEDKIFYKVKKAVKASCAAYIVVDTSGSTSGSIFNNEFDACASIELGFGKLIPLKIAAYDSDYDFRFRVIRDFNNKRTDTNLSYNFKKMQQAGGGTPTAEAMALAGYELEKRQEKNKLLVVITDGCPDNNKKVKEEVHRLRKKGIKVVAILISDGNSGGHLVDDFNEMYEGKDVITERSENIATYLIKLLTKWITSSMYH